jgi:hypothetical protein
MNTTVPIAATISKCWSAFQTLLRIRQRVLVANRNRPKNAYPRSLPSVAAKRKALPVQAAAAQARSVELDNPNQTGGLESEKYDSHPKSAS